MNKPSGFHIAIEGAHIRTTTKGPHVARPLPRYTQDQDPNKLDRIIDTQPNPPPTPTSHRSGEGDQRRMRSIPVIAQGVPGTIPHTEGYAALALKQRIAARYQHHRTHRT
jgi:hypothetical protein